jgi:ABC-2 type transport system ATP-binding protein
MSGDKKILAIEAKNLYKSFGEAFTLKRFLKLPWELFLRLSGRRAKKSVLKDLSFKVETGSVVGFLGPNGAGKSTTLKVMLNLIRKDSGESYIAGFNTEYDYDLALKDTGALVELPVFYEFMSGLENLIITSKIYKHIKPAAIDESLKKVGLFDHRHKKVSQYSTGMRQKLYVAKILLTGCSIIILDEPTSGMDPKGQAEMRELIKSLAAEKKTTVLISSHLLYEIEQICDYVVIIKDGSVVTYGKVSGLLSTELEIYELEVAPQQTESCMEYLGRKEYVSEAVLKLRANAGFIELKLGRESVPRLIKELVADKFDIYNYVKTRRSLENYFLEVTGENGVKSSENV